MSKSLVTYFSATGATARAAQALAEALGADIREIRPAVPYTSEDLDWRNTASRSTVEMQDLASRPAILAAEEGPEDYDVIYLGFPIWWHTAPAIVRTFLESYDFSGKTIVLFATSGGGDFGETHTHLTQLLPESVELKESAVLRGQITQEKLAAWLGSF